jgi:hypothetical protein
VAEDPERKATKSKARFDEIVAALMRVGKDETDAIMEAEKKARSARKPEPKPKPKRRS